MTDFIERFQGVNDPSDRRNPNPAGPVLVPDLSTMRNRRRQLRITQEEAAANVSVSISTYQRWERGDQTPSFRSQRRIADYFAVPLAVIAVWFPPRTP